MSSSSRHHIVCNKPPHSNKRFFQHFSTQKGLFFTKHEVFSQKKKEKKYEKSFSPKYLYEMSL